MIISSYAATAKNCLLTPYFHTAKPLSDLDVEVAISHCGICYSDIHMIDNDWGETLYPFIPGHEIIGTVTKIGDKVHHLEKGQRVGISWQHGACLTCSWCQQYKENLCSEFQSFYEYQHGGFANSIRVHHHFVYPIPDIYSSAQAAPLMCAGLTVYNAISHYLPPSASLRIGIIGLGGLGHLAVQYCRALGYDVTVFSSTPEKESDAKRLGASQFTSNIDEAEINQMANSLDFILATTHADLPWQAFINTLRPEGKLCFVGVPKQPLSIPVLPLIMGQKSICASTTGGSTCVKEMLEFSAKQHIMPLVEILPMSEANNAITKLRHNQARYRIVLSH